MVIVAVELVVRALSVVWTTPLVATLGMSLTIPLAMVADMIIHGRHYSAVYILGSVQVWMPSSSVFFLSGLMSKIYPITDLTALKCFSLQSLVLSTRFLSSASLPFQLHCMHLSFSFTNYHVICFLAGIFRLRYCKPCRSLFTFSRAIASWNKTCSYKSVNLEAQSLGWLGKDSRKLWSLVSCGLGIASSTSFPFAPRGWWIFAVMNNESQQIKKDTVCCSNPSQL